jgi:hypothetical protein
VKPPPLPKLPHWWPRLQSLFESIDLRFDLLEKTLATERKTLMAFIDDLEAKVAAESTVDDSIIALLNQIAQALKDAGVDPARQAAVLASLQANADKIAAAVTANTPAAP